MEMLSVSVLSDDQIERIHSASLAILSETGVEVPHPDLLGRFADAGASVNISARRVRIPPDLVERCLASAGRSFTLYGRDPARRAAFGRGRRNYNSIAGEAMWVDEPGGARRYAALPDVGTAARLGDALDGITIVGAMADPHDLPADWRWRRSLLSAPAERSLIASIVWSISGASCGSLDCSTAAFTRHGARLELRTWKSGAGNSGRRSVNPTCLSLWTKCWPGRLIPLWSPPAGSLAGIGRKGWNQVLRKGRIA